MKATQTELYERKNKMREMLLTGYSYQGVKQYAINEYSVSERQAERYIEDINKENKEYYEDEINYLMTSYTAKLDLLYKKAWEKENLNLALQCLREKMKIQGISEYKYTHAIFNDGTNRTEELKESKSRQEAIGREYAKKNEKIIERLNSLQEEW